MDKKNINKYTFHSFYNSISISLDDVNIINIENEQTFHRVPKLAHHLEHIVYKPGLYSMDSIATL